MRRIGLILWAIVIASGCSKEDPKAAAVAPEEARASARAAWVKARSPEELSLLEAPAKVLAPPEAIGAVTAPFPGRVVKIHVRAGQSVAEGEAIADVAMVELVACGVGRLFGAAAVADRRAIRAAAAGAGGGARRRRRGARRACAAAARHRPGRDRRGLLFGRLGVVV